MKASLQYVVEALYSTDDNGLQQLHTKTFDNQENLLDAKENAIEYFNLVIEMLQDCNTLEIEYRKNTIFAASDLYRKKTTSIAFVEDLPENKGIRFGFRINNCIAQHLSLDCSQFYELDFLDDYCKERDKQSEHHATIERRIYQTFYPSQLEMLRKNDATFDIFYIRELMKEQSILELQIVKNLEEIDLLFETVCAFLNSEKGGFIVFKNFEDPHQQIQEHEFENIVEILKSNIFYPYKKLIYQTTIPSLYLFENHAYPEISIMRIKPSPEQNASYKANNYTNKFVRHKIFGNVECLD